MAIVTLQLPPVNADPGRRPVACPHCGSRLLQRWGTLTRAIRDTQLRHVTLHRYRCTACLRTFRHSPTGIGRAAQSTRLRHVAALLWTLGLSLRGVTVMCAAFGVALSHMTVLRDVRQLAATVRHQRKTHPVRGLGLDGTGACLAGRGAGVVVAVDLGRGVPVAVGVLDERDPAAVQAWLAPLVRELGVVVLVTDDLASHAVVADELRLAHQVCQFHVRRWVRRAVASLALTLEARWQPMLTEVERLIQTLEATGSAQLLALWEQIPPQRLRKGEAASPLYQLKQLLLRLSQSWPRYRLAQEHPDRIPGTNNGSEQVIGRFKVRSRSVRGFKRASGVENAMLLCTGLLS